MSVDTERRIDRVFCALIVFALLYLLLQVARTFATGGTLAPSDVAPTSTTFPVHIVHTPSTHEIRIEHHG